MGAWGEKAWENDTAADWFATFMEKVDTNYVLEQAEAVLELPEDNEDEVRAIAYIIGHLGRVYIWPIDEFDRLKDIKERLADYLESMLEPDSEFMDLWEEDEDVKREIQKEIALLKE